MSQNTSSAVMAQRQEPADSFDYFPTPLWATRALCEWLASYVTPRSTVLEPACGQGHMSRALLEYFDHVESIDIQDMGYGTQADYLFGPIQRCRKHLIITNPPFKLAEQFIARALQESTSGVAMLCRSTFTEGVGRYERLYSKTPPSHVLQFAERVPMHKGKLAGKGGSTATAYAWFVWLKAHEGRGTMLEIIPPCRKRLERDGDYDDSAKSEGEA